jgi:tetratricopeptide (TPR) repeat protein
MLGGNSEWQQELLAALSPLAEDSAEKAVLQNQIGSEFQSRRDYEGVMEQYSQALWHQYDDSSLEVAVTCDSIGSLFRDMGDIEGARIYFQRALEIPQQHGSSLAPSNAVLGSLDAPSR